jgi:hypothetical protein
MIDCFLVLNTSDRYSSIYRCGCDQLIGIESNHEMLRCMVVIGIIIICKHLIINVRAEQFSIFSIQWQSSNQMYVVMSHMGTIVKVTMKNEQVLLSHFLNQNILLLLIHDIANSIHLRRPLLFTISFNCQMLVGRTMY